MDEMNIKAYEGTDAYYEGSEEDYEEFLKSVEASESFSSPSSIKEDETISIKGVIDMVKRKAGEIGTAAAKAVTDFRATAAEKKAATKQIDNLTFDGIEDKKKEDGETNDKMRNKQAQNLSASEIIKTLNSLKTKLNDIEIKQIENRNNADRNANDIRVLINNLNNDITQLKQGMSSVTKLNDSVFDMKNTQANTKKSLAELSESFFKLKKKYTTGILITSILSVLIIVLEIINILS